MKFSNNGGIEITAEVAQDNIASNRLLTNNGFKIKKKSQFKKYKMNISFDGFIQFKPEFLEDFCPEALPIDLGIFESGYYRYKRGDYFEKTDESGQFLSSLNA